MNDNRDPLTIEEDEILTMALATCRVLARSRYARDGNIRRGVYQLLAALEEKLGNTQPDTFDEPGKNG